MFVLVSMQLSNHVHTTSEAFQALKWLCDMYISHIYAILNLEFRKCIKFKIHCANCLAVLHICAP